MTHTPATSRLAVLTDKIRVYYTWGHNESLHEIIPGLLTYVHKTAGIEIVPGAFCNTVIPFPASYFAWVPLRRVLDLFAEWLGGWTWELKRTNTAQPIRLNFCPPEQANVTH